MPRRPRRPIHLERLEDRLAPAVVTWNTDASGSWHEPANWLDDGGLQRVPTATDTVVLDRGAANPVVTVSASVTVAGLTANESLHFTGGTFRVTSAFALAAPWELSGGTLHAAGAELAVAAPGRWTGGTLGDDGTVANASTLTIADGAAKVLADELTNRGTIRHTAADNLRLFRSGIVNEAGGVFEFRADGDVVNEQNTTGVRNRGTVRKTAGAGESDFTAVPFLNLGGTVEVLAGTLRIGEGHSNTQEHTGGHFHVAPGAALQLSSQLSTTGPPDFAGAYTGSGGGRVEIGGTISVTGTATFDFPAGMLHWTAGSITEGTFVNLAALSVSGDGTRTINGAVLENRGMVVQSGTQTWAGDPGSTNVLRNAAGGTVEVRGTLATTVSLRTEYAGLVRKVGSTETLFLDGTGAFQGGTFEVIDGTLSFAAFVSGSGGATFDIAPAARVELLGVHQEWTVGGTLRGVGGGRFELYRDLNAPAGETLTLDFAEGMFQVLDGGRLVRSVANAGFLQLGNAAANELVSGTLTNTGTVVRTGTGNLSLDSGSALVNRGLVVVNGDGALALPVGDAVVNEGVFRRATGAGTFAVTGPSNARFRNTGTVEVSAGTLSLASGVPQVAAGVLTAGTWDVGDGATLNLSGTTLTTNRAAVTLRGTAAFPKLDTLHTNEGTLRLRGGRDFAAAGAFTNAGTLDLGAGSTLTAAGTFATTGTLAVELGEAPGRVAAGGTATLGGTLAVALAPGYAPAGGERVTIATFPDRVGDFATFTGLDPFFVPEPGTDRYELRAVSGGADLRVTGATHTGGGTVGNAFTVTYTAANVGAAAVPGAWRDSVYLSADDRLDPLTDVLLGRVERTGGLGPGATYTATLTVPIPGVVTGSYRVIVVADSQLAFGDTDRANNARVAPADATIDVLRLTAAPRTGTVPAGGAAHFRYDAAAGADAEFRATGAAAGFDVYVRYGAIPTATDFDFRVGAAGEADRRATLRAPLGGAYYVLVVGRAGGAFALTARPLAFEVTQASPERGANAGTTVVVVRGAGFTPASRVTLAGEAVPTQFVDAGTLLARLDLTGRAVGDYALAVADPAGTAAFPRPFTVTTGVPGKIEATISVPDAARIGTLARFPLTVTYTNVGDADAAAPLLMVQAAAAVKLSNSLRVEARSSRSRSAPRSAPAAPLPSVAFLGLGGADAPTVLRPGETRSVTLEFSLENVPPGTGPLEFVLYEANLPQPLDWTDLGTDTRPAGIAAEAWAELIADLERRVGGTMGDLYRVVLENAAQLAALGRTTGDLGALLGFEFLQADAETDVLARFTRGAFGYAVPDPTDWLAGTDGPDRVFLRAPGGVRYFALAADGTFVGGPADRGVVRRVGTHYELTEPDGSGVVFRPDGRLDFVRAANGNRVTAGYTGTLLTSFTDSFGDTTTFTYGGGANPVVTAATDPVGRVTTYEYVQSNRGPLLARVTDAAGSVTLDWGADGDRDRHLLRGVAGPDGVGATLDYDSRDRLIRTALTGGAAATTYGYGPSGQVFVTAADGSTAEVALNEFGRVGRLIDPLGRVLSVRYDDAGNATRLTAPGGLTTLVGYDARGNVVRVTDPRGTAVGFDLAATVSRLTGFTDENGNRTAYDAAGNPTGVTFPDGTAETGTPNALGLPTTTTDRAGAVTAYTYDAASLLRSRTFADGSRDDYDYDARRNLVAATRAAGGVARTVTFAYDAADRLTRQTDANGRVLEFAYDAAGRRTRTSDGAGYVVNAAYDAAGRLERLTDGADALLVRYEYDALGRVRRETKGNGEATEFVYDAAGRLRVQTEFAPGGAGRDELVYEYDAAGGPVRLTTNAGVTEYGYDAAGQLVRVELPGGRVVEYAYDAAGNRTTVRDSGANATYATNALNQYTSAGGETFTYDLNGALRTRTGPAGTTTYDYDLSGQLIRVTAPGEVRDYEYDALGNRVASTLNGVRTEHLIDPFGLTNVVSDFAAGGARVAGYVHGYGLEARTDAAGTGYYHFDLTGNTRVLTGPDGAVLNRYEYLPFGETVSSTEAVANPFEFVGQYGVTTDGLVHMRNRWYDPATGRFTQPDPIGLAGGDANLYAYTANRPVDFVDPDGLSSDKVDGTGQAADASGASNSRTPSRPRGKAATRATTGRKVEPVNPSEKTRNQPQPRPKEAAEAAGKAAKEAGEEASERTLKPLLDGLSDNFPGAKLLPGAGAAITLSDTSYALPERVGRAIIGEGPIVGDIILLLGDAFNAEVERRTGYVDPDWPPYMLEKLRQRDENWTPLDDDETRPVESRDPNDILGPAGVGPLNHLVAGTYDYTIRFENVAAATAPAARVVVTQTLDPDLDPATLELARFGFGGDVFTIAPGQQNFAARLDLATTRGILVDVTAAFDPATRLLTWTFVSLEPATGDETIDPTKGLLPPNVASPEGEGFVAYRVRPRAGLGSGTRFDAAARIVFDANDPIDTAPIFNTLDAGRPASAVAPLPAVTVGGTFTVTWAGADDAGGSGVAAYDVFVSTDGGPFARWLDDTAATSAAFPGQVGCTYAFYTVAADLVGFEEAPPAGADATTTTVAPPPPAVAPDPRLVGWPTFSAGVGSDVVSFGPDGAARQTRRPLGAVPGGVRVAEADVTGDGVPDVIVGTGPGVPTRVVVLDGATGAPVFDAAPFEPAFLGGVYVAAGDLDGDGVAELVVTPDEGGGPRVQVYAGRTFGKRADFFGIDDPNFRGGARAAVGDFDGDGAGDLVVAAGFGGGPRVAAYAGRTVGGELRKLFADFFLFEPALRNGAFVAVGDVDGDGFADLVGGGGPGGGPRVLALSGTDLLAGLGGGARALANFFAGNPDNRGGVRVAVKNLDGDRRADLVVGDGAGAGTRVTGYFGSAPGGAPAFALDAAAGELGGAFVG